MVNHDELIGYHETFGACWKLFKDTFEKTQGGPVPDDAWSSIMDQACAIGKASPIAVKLANGTLEAINLLGETREDTQ